MLSPTFFTFDLFSKNLEATFSIHVYLPPNFNINHDYPLLLLNDGQDLEAMDMKTILTDVFRHQICKPFVLAGIEAIDRLQTYGVAGIPDFKGRGGKAIEYSNFVVNEALPAILKVSGLIQFSEKAVGGFSLGGLSAFDLAWVQPETFSKVMVCSGAFWWRSKDLKEGYSDADRIMHQKVLNTLVKPNLKIWLQSGTLDEKEDRNHNGIIDSIEDMRDLVQALKQKGFKENEDLFFKEMIGGKHSLETYGIVFPYFVHWAFGE
jgi:enterochelin esterase-like enzyme